MKKPFKYATLGLGALVLFATTYFTIFAVMGVPITETPAAEHVFGKQANSGSPAQPIVSKPAPKAQPEVESAERASDVMSAFVFPAGVQADTLRTLKAELFDQLEQVRETRALLEGRERNLDDRESDLAERFDELMSLRGRLDEYHLELEARAEELDHQSSTKDQRRSARLIEMSSYLIEGEATHAAALLGGMDPADAAQILDVLQPERAGEILRAMTPDASREVWEAGLAADS
jgi:flagellar motility protein MotE (MotC chaperone)